MGFMAMVSIFGGPGCTSAENRRVIVSGCYTEPSISLKLTPADADDALCRWVRSARTLLNWDRNLCQMEGCRQVGCGKPNPADANDARSGWAQSCSLVNWDLGMISLSNGRLRKCRA